MNSTFASEVLKELKEAVDCELYDNDMLIEVCKFIAEKRGKYDRLDMLLDLYLKERD